MSYVNFLVTQITPPQAQKASASIHGHIYQSPWFVYIAELFVKEIQSLTGVSGINR